MTVIYKAWIFNWGAGSFIDEMFFWSEEVAQAWLLGRVTDEMLDSQEYEWGIDVHNVFGSPPTKETETGTGMRPRMSEIRTLLKIGKSPDL